MSINLNVLILTIYAIYTTKLIPQNVNRFWKSQGKTIIVSEHRLYYLRGLADRFIYITGGKVEKDYSAAEFESLTEQQRAKLGLRTFILEDLLPPKALPQAGQQMELHNFCFATVDLPEPDGPTRAVMVPGWMARFTSCKTSVVPS